MVACLHASCLIHCSTDLVCLCDVTQQLFVVSPSCDVTALVLLNVLLYARVRMPAPEPAGVYILKSVRNFRMCTVGRIKCVFGLCTAPLTLMPGYPFCAHGVMSGWVNQGRTANQMIKQSTDLNGMAYSFLPDYAVRQQVIQCIELNQGFTLS